MPRYEDHLEHFRLIREAVLRAADPYEAVHAACTRRGMREPGLRRVGWLAIGKAAVRMRDGMLAAVGEGAEGSAGIAVAPEGVDGGQSVVIGDHPLPTRRSVAAGEAVRSFVERCGAAERGRGDAEAGVLTVLLSGGASALVCLPEDGVSLDDLRAVTSALLRAGATIGELNAVRKHVERLKGGRLAALAAPCRVDALILSDVIGDDLDIIGSGPVTPDPTTFADALAVLERRGVLDAGPTVTARLRAGAAGELPETPKPGDAVFDRVRARIVASNAAAVEAARAAAEGLGFRIASVQRGIAGDAACAGMAVARSALRQHPSQRPLAVIAGGETTVNVGAGAGKGGRNQEAALAAALGLDASYDAAVMAFATDGVDGPTDAAGAVVNTETCKRARAMGLDPVDALRRHDSYTLLDCLGCLIRTGPTGTNVNDIVVALAY